LRSRRFDVKDTSQFMSALRDISARAEGNGEQGGFDWRFWERRSNREKSNPETGERESESSTQGGVARQVLEEFSQANLQDAGRAMNADYVLVIGIRTVDYRHVHVTDPYESGGVYHPENHWAPTVIYRVFDV